MALGVCIPDLIQQGKLTGERAERAQQLYDELVLQYRRRFDQPTAESMATKSTIDALERDTLTRRRQVLLQAKAQGRIEKQARWMFAGGKYKDDAIKAEAMLAHLIRDADSKGIANVEFRAGRIRDLAWRRMYELMDKHRPGLMGQVRNRADLDDVVRELKGETTGNANAKEIAAAWRETAEWLRQRFNAAGGAIGKLETWDLPQHHDARLVGAVSKQEWIDTIAPKLDRARMIDEATGLAMSDARMQMVLGDVYETIRTGGWATQAPGVMGGKSIANRHAQHRVLHFNTADDWLEYQGQFGGGTAYEAMMGHIERMSRDIAAIEILGPNPAATIEWMKQIVTKEAAIDGRTDVTDAANKWNERIDQVWREVSGDNRRVESKGLALLGSTLRHHQVSTKLGSAVISAISDQATAALTRAYNGLPLITGVRRYFSLLNPANKEDRAFARRWLILNEELIGRNISAGRMHMEEMFGMPPSGASGLRGKVIGGLERSQAFSARWSDRVMKVSGLNAHTIAMREMTMWDFANAFTTNRASSFDDLAPPLRRFFDNYGINARDWDVLRNSEPVQVRGSEWIVPDKIGDERVADRIMEAMMQEVVYAVPTGGLYARARVNAAGLRGSLQGEFVKTGFQFKMFPMMVVGMHWQRMMSMSNFTSRAGYATAYLGMMTAFGGVSYQLAEMLKGKDPRPVADGDFLWRAILKGGGLGIFGDSVHLSQGDYGRSLGNLAVGPTWGSGQTAFEAVSAGVQSLTADGAEEEEKAARERSKAVVALSREIPGNNIWYIRAAYERLLVDTMASWADPDYGDSIRRAEQRARKTGQEFFLPPGGGVVPERAPDLANMLAEAPEN